MATVIENTYTYDYNRAAIDTSTALKVTQSFLLYLKNFLTGVTGGVTTGAWTTYYSCDSVTAGTANDAVDRWATIANVVRATAGSAHSWYVLKSPTIGGTNYYCTVDVSGATDATALNLIFSKAAPTGGTTTARPTSTDEWVHTASALLNDGTATAHKTHGIMATTGQWLVLFSKNGSGRFYGGCGFFVLADAKGTDQVPVVSLCLSNASGPTCFNAQVGTVGHAAGAWRGRTWNNSAVLVMSPATIGVATGGLSVMDNIASGGDPQDNTFPDFPIWICGAAASHYSIRGRLVDMRMCPTNVADGDVEPAPSGPIVATCLGKGGYSTSSVWYPANVAPSL